MPGGAGFLPSTVGHRGSGNVVPSLKLTASSPLKIDGKGRWSFFRMPSFQVRIVSFREGIYIYIYIYIMLHGSKKVAYHTSAFYIPFRQLERKDHEEIQHWLLIARTSLHQSDQNTASLVHSICSEVPFVGLTIHTTYVSSDTSDKVLIQQVLDISSNHKWILESTGRKFCIKKMHFSPVGTLNTDLHLAESYIYIHIYVYICVVFPMWITWFLQSIVHVAKYAQTFPKACFFLKNTATLILRWFKYFNWFLW